jgi:hypothetical protein
MQMAISEIYPSARFSAHIYSNTLNKKKKKESVFVYGLFLRTKTIIAPTRAAGIKYVSDIEVSGASVGAGVARAESTDIAVSANEGQYEFEPAKVAIIVYCPGMSGGTHR